MSLYFLPSSLHRPLLSNSSTNRRRHGVGHIRIQNAGDYYDLYGAKRFSTLDEPVDYYRQHRRVLSKATGVTDMELRNPLSCEEPRWAWHCKAWYTMAGDFAVIRLSQVESHSNHEIFITRTREPSLNPALFQTIWPSQLQEMPTI